MDYLNNSGASNDGIVGYMAIAFGYDHVTLARNALWNNDSERFVTLELKGSLYRSSYSNESSV